MQRIMIAESSVISKGFGSNVASAAENVISSINVPNVSTESTFSFNEAYI